MDLSYHGRLIYLIAIDPPNARIYLTETGLLEIETETNLPIYSI